MDLKIIDTDEKKENGINKCPNCGSSEIIYDIEKNKLKCNYCKTEFNSEKIISLEKKSENLVSEVRGSGSKDLKDSEDIITLRCDGCGAEVVINTTKTLNARCHWCRSILSINSQISNGAVPDCLLPFKLTKENAQNKIESFVNERKFFANKKFKQEFVSDNIMGVYFPYLLIDANCHALFKGEGGKVSKKYEIVVGKDSNGNEKKETVYDIKTYDIEREFDIAIDDLSIESSIDKLNKANKEKTTNIINSIMPFDTENCIKYKANYLFGYTSEKRDINIFALEEKVNHSLKDIARHAINKDLLKYDSGIRWDDEDFNIKGKQWISAYLPVWLYSYMDQKNILHYVAVNGRTGETMGSIPLNKKKLIILSSIIFLSILIIPIIILFLIAKSFNFSYYIILIGVFNLISAIATSMIYYFVKKSKYLNFRARHRYETETKNEITNIRRKDIYKHTLKEKSFSTIFGVNNRRIVGEYTNFKKN